MSSKKYVYYATTALIVLPMLGGGIMDLMGGAEVEKMMDHLGFPHWFATWLGVWKLASVVALLVPKFPRLKEWAYAGIAIDLLSASVAHIAVGDPAPNAITPLVIFGIAMASWATRPDSRKLPTA